MLCEGETHGRRRSRFPCCLDAVRGETLCRTGLESSPVSSDSPWARYDGPMGTMKRPPKNIIGDSQFLQMAGLGDRKSTRLNSSHLGISYAVFCLKKKNKKTINDPMNKPQHTTMTRQLLQQDS